MARFKLLAGCFALTLVLPGVGLADPWKDESGNGHGDRRGDYKGERRDRYRDERLGDRRGFHPAPYVQPRIPPGHLPPPGEYRQWFLDRPPGHQPPPQRW